jgi:hypothetical protein
MQVSVLEFLAGSAGIAAAGALAYLYWQAKRGVWTAGYARSDRNRPLGPG